MARRLTMGAMVDADAVPSPPRVGYLTEVEHAYVYAQWLCVQNPRSVPPHIGFAFGPLRALELATASGDRLLERLVARAIHNDRPGRWLHDYGSRVEDLLRDDGTVIGQRIRPARCPHKHDERGVCIGLRTNVRALRAEAWAECWACVALDGVRDPAGDPPGTTGPRRAPRVRHDRQAAALAVWLLKHGHRALEPHDWPSTAAAFFGRTSVGSRDGGIWPREVDKVRKLEQTAQHARRIWRLACRGI